jgi:hypothetical protein
MKLLGIPLTIWGVACLVMAAVWMFVWPKNRSVASGSLSYLVLRWFHALVWLFLAAATFIAGFDILGGADTARFIALLALLTYLAFMATLMVTK